MDVSTRHGSGACSGWMSRHGTAWPAIVGVWLGMRCLETAGFAWHSSVESEVSDSRRCVQGHGSLSMAWPVVVSVWPGPMCSETAEEFTRHSVVDSDGEGLGAVCAAMGLDDGLSRHAPRLFAYGSAVVCTATAGHFSRHSVVDSEVKDSGRWAHGHGCLNTAWPAVFIHSSALVCTATSKESVQLWCT